jgi:hypothetical protein
MPAMLLVVSLFITTGQEAISATADEKRRLGSDNHWNRNVR